MVPCPIHLPFWLTLSTQKRDGVLMLHNLFLLGTILELINKVLCRLTLE